MSEEEKMPQQNNSGQGSIQVSGNGNLVLQLDSTLTRLAESQMQAAFYVATGIHCSKPARFRLEDLLDNHGFTVRELRRVWNSGAMTHNRKVDVFEFHSRGLDLTIGWLAWFVLSAAFLVYELEYVEKAIQTPLFKSGAFMLGLLAYMAGLMFFFYWFIWPQRIATRIRQALSEPHSTEDAGPQATPAAI